MSGRPSKPYREFLRKAYRTLRTDKDRHQFLVENGGGRVMGIAPAEFPQTEPKLKPCECGNQHPEERITGTTIGDTYIICPKCHRRTAQWGVAWAAREAWNHGLVYFAEETQQQIKLF